MAIVELKNISKKYDKNNYTIKNLNLTINDKEFMVLVGPSGCGKTTLLRMIAGLEDITEGDLLIDGVRMNDVHPKDRDIAMVFQNYALYPHMTVAENMSFALKLKKVDDKIIEKKINEVAQILNLDKVLNKKPKELSGGQRQRVALGRAIVRNPKVFLFDEPLSNLDAKLRVHMRAEILKLQKELKITTIYVTHDQTEAMTMGDRIVVLRDGFIQQVDTPLNVYNSPANIFVAGFIGSPQMNFIDGTLSKNDNIYFLSDDKTIKFNFTDEAKFYDNLLNNKIIIGIRPEDLSFTNNFENSIMLEVDVDIIETLGSISYVYCKIGNNNLIAVSNPYENIQNSTKQKLYVNLNSLHFFDYNLKSRIIL